MEESDLLWIKGFSSSYSINLVWCDPYLEKEEIAQQVLRQLDLNLVLITDASLCESTVQKLHRDECKSIFLLLPGSLANDLLPLVTSDVHTIFIFSFNQTEYASLSDRPKVDSVSNSLPTLIERIKNCFGSLEHAYAIEHEQQSLRNLTKENAAFVWFHVFRNVIRHFRKSPKTKDKMMSRFREYYRDNPQQLKRLLEFSETYESDRALWWYSKPSFISDVMNKTMRARDIDGLFDLQYCIVDLCELLEKLPKPSEQFTTYRGVLMDRDKFNIIKETIAKGDFVSTRGFLSTSLSIKTATAFGSNDSNHSNKVEIIYEIDVPVGLKHVTYGNIAPFSMFDQEKEILFDLDSTFQVVEIKPDGRKDDCWFIRLQASDYGRKLAAKYLDDSNRELKDLQAEILFGKLLIDMGDNDKAIDYFQRLLNQSNENQHDEFPTLSRVSRGIVMNNIGRAYFSKGDHHKALYWFDSALDLQRKVPELTYHVATTMNNKGVLQMAAAQWATAMTAFEYAADVLRQSHHYEELANTLENMGMIKSQTGEYNAAVDLYHQAREAIRAEGIHDQHPHVAENKMNIAFVYMEQARWQDALNTLNEVKAIRQKILLPSHHDMGRTWFTIGLVLRNLEHYEEAFEHMNRALIIYKRSFSNGHPHIANAYNSMANLKSVQNQFAEALPLYEQAKEQFYQFHNTTEHPDIGRVLNNMGQAHRHLGHLPEAFDYLTKALSVRQDTLGLKHPDTATTWVNLSLAHRANNDLNKALEYAQCGLAIRREKLRPEHEDLLETEEYVVELQQQIRAQEQQ